MYSAFNCTKLTNFITHPQAKAAKKEPLNSSIADGDSADQTAIVRVLARWADKKYYAGRLKDQTTRPNNRFVVIFEDGATKTLAGDVIVFGGPDGTLPLLDQYVHARIDDDTYEPGLVTKVQTNESGATEYTVVTESKEVHVTSSDIYLEEDQAKVIQRATTANAGATATSSTTGVVASTTVSDTASSPSSLAAGANTAQQQLKSPSTPTSKRTARPSVKLGESGGATTVPSRSRATATTGSASKSKPSATTTTTTAVDEAEPSTSAAAATAAAAGARQTGRRNKRYS